MKTLKNEFGKNGLTYKLIKRTDKVALFGLTGEYTNKVITYEVDPIRVIPANTRFGRDFEETEAITSNEQFGRDGSAHIHKLKDALKYFDELNTKLSSQT